MVVVLPVAGGKRPVRAWISPAARRGVSRQLLAAARRAVGREATNAAFIDTLATVHYRGRRFDAAVSEQRRALQLAHRPMLVSQMARFLDARLRVPPGTTSLPIPTHPP